MANFRGVIALCFATAAALMLSACSALSDPNNSAAPAANSRSAQQTCERLDAATNRLKLARTNGPGTQEAILANFRILHSELNLMSEEATDAELKTSLAGYSTSLNRFIEVLDAAKSSPQPDQQKFNATGAELDASGTKTKALCKPYWDAK